MFIQDGIRTDLTITLQGFFQIWFDRCCGPRSPSIWLDSTLADEYSLRFWRVYEKMTSEHQVPNVTVVTRWHGCRVSRFTRVRPSCCWPGLGPWTGGGMNILCRFLTIFRKVSLTNWIQPNVIFFITIPARPSVLFHLCFLRKESRPTRYLICCHLKSL